MNPGALVTEAAGGRYLNHVEIGRHRFLADEPVSVGGYDAGPSPFQLLAAALGACTSMTLRMYAERKQLDLRRVTLDVRHDRHRAHADDAAVAGVDTAGGTVVDRFTRVVQLDGDLDDAQRAALLRIAEQCPVHRALSGTAAIVTRLA